MFNGRLKFQEKRVRMVTKLNIGSPNEGGPGTLSGTNKQPVCGRDAAFERTWMYSQRVCVLFRRVYRARCLVELEILAGLTGIVTSQLRDRLAKAR